MAGLATHLPEPHPRHCSLEDPELRRARNIRPKPDQGPAPWGTWTLRANSVPGNSRRFGTNSRKGNMYDRLKITRGARKFPLQKGPKSRIEGPKTQQGIHGTNFRRIVSRVQFQSILNRGEGRSRDRACRPIGLRPGDTRHRSPGQSSLKAPPRGLPSRQHSRFFSAVWISLSTVHQGESIPIRWGDVWSVTVCSALRK